MIIRAIKTEDLDQIGEIWLKHYKNEFSLPDFLHNFLCSFLVEENDKIISVCGVRTIAEAVAVTNKDISIRKRRAALYKILQASLFTIGAHNYNQLHAFVQDAEWKKHLLNVGFMETKGEALYLGVGDGQR